MSQYGKRSYYIDVVVSDFSYPLWRSDMCIDAIITDRKYQLFSLTYKLYCKSLHLFINYSSLWYQRSNRKDRYN